MDIIPNKRSKLLYQKGDQKIKGVIDLRCFSNEKKRGKKEGNNKKTVFEIIKKEDKKKEPTKQTSFLKNKHSFFNKIYNKKEKFKTKVPNLLPKTEFSTKLKFRFSLLWQRSFVSFVSTVVIVSLTVFSLSFIQKGIEEKGKILGVSTQAYDYLKQAGQSASSQDFENSINNFDSARLNFLSTKTAIVR